MLLKKNFFFQSFGTFCKVVLKQQSFCKYRCHFYRANKSAEFLRGASAYHEQIRNFNCPTNGLKVPKKELQPTKKELAPREQYFRELQIKDKATFLKVINAYNEKDKIKRGHIEFIYAALKYIQDSGFEADLEIYKKLMDVFPKGKMIPKNLIQAEFFHFPRHQECALYTMDLMEYSGICPDKEMGEIIRASFGRSSHVYKKYARMLYWMPKLKNINPYQMPDPMPSDVRELARLALKKMSVDKRTTIVEYDANKLEESIDKTWIMSAQSPVQQKLIEEHSEEKALYIEGPFLVWLRKLSMTYFVLRADSKIYPDFEQDDDDVSNLSLYMFGEPKPEALVLGPSSVHEQEDGIIMGMCCTGTSSKDSLLSWVRFLQESNPKLDTIPILFKLKSSPSSLVAINIGETSAAEVEETTSQS
ncbi:evolutionarily conserved signaling intermediate in Toll pathway, mitochondrial-like [Uloborus diversus]|uniref:evolutionarily conserved signaling intermediate in Toll pathway, mitochondrial-like n=1 Tax=Uloborus diversus TaxID=327109 RepID=UPI002409F146|nr:evolutionarily conserved signaling intermediate in Toll pathway, mitochondrial-like [Uloborus diversus]